MANAGTLADTSGSHSTFPPFQKEYFASQLVALTVCFVLLYALMRKIALPRIGSILAERSRLIADDLNAAQRFKKESDAADAAYAKSLAEAHGHAQDIASAAHKEQATEAEGAYKRLEVELHQRFANAEQSIAAARSVAMKNVEAMAEEAAAAIVKRLIGEPPIVQRSRSAAR